MLLRLKMYRFLLKIAIYLLPFPAFDLGWRIWALCLAFMNRPVKYPVHGHFTLVLFSAFLWAFMAERYKVTSVDELFRERTGARAAWSASAATAVVLLGVLYFGRNAVFPRGLFVCCVVSLLGSLMIGGESTTVGSPWLRTERPRTWVVTNKMGQRGLNLVRSLALAEEQPYIAAAC